MMQIVKGVLPLVVVVAGALGARGLILTAPRPPKKPRAERAVLVEVQAVEKTSRPISVEANGVVIPAYQVDLAAEVGGRVVWRHPQLTVGGQVNEGEVLLRIDPRDYELAIQQQAAALERARTDLELERGRQRVAEAEWQLFGDEQGQAADKDLALREPQRKAAELSLETAKTGLAQARLQRGRTVIKAPFDAVVRSNSTEVGRLVTPGQALANLVDTRLFLVSVSVPLADLRWLKIPGTNAPLLTREIADKARASDDPSAAFAELASLALITQRVGSERVQRPGVIVRMLGDLDPVGRMARLLVSVRDPLGRQQESHEQGAAGLPILIGAYVNVDIEGQRLDDVVELPRVALREGNKVYLMDDKATLQEREVEIVHRTDDSVLVQSGLSGGEKVIVSALSAPVIGMELRVAEGETQSAKDGGPPRAGVARDKPDERVQ